MNVLGKRGYLTGRAELARAFSCGHLSNSALRGLDYKTTINLSSCIKYIPLGQLSFPPCGVVVLFPQYGSSIPTGGRLRIWMWMISTDLLIIELKWRYVCYLS